MPPIIKVLRLYQWPKNLFCLAGAFFSGQFMDLFVIQSAAFSFVAFSMASSASYVLNDLVDREADRGHPKKKFRPLASGELEASSAISVALILFASSLFLAYTLGHRALICLIIYFAINVAYSFKLKHVVIADAICISSGFVLRLLCGIYAIHELPTGWITLCTFFLALFLAFAKRRCELYYFVNKDILPLRPVLRDYTIEFLDFLLNNALTMTVMSYAIFTTTSGKNPALVITVPMVYYTINYFKRLVMVHNIGEDADKIIMKDRIFQISVILWFLTYMLITRTNFDLFVS